MVNLTIGASVNFTRADPMPVLQSRDVIWPVFMSFGGLMLAAFTSPLILVVAVPLAVLYVPAVVMARWMVRRRLQSQVDVRLDQVRTEGVVRPFPKRC
jgi:Sec-independent protein secretion pathway component TatC